MSKKMKILLTLFAVVCLGALVGAFASCDAIWELLDRHKHDYTETVVAPTCTEEGYTLKKCECGNEKTENRVAALGHDYAAEFTVEKQPTCTEAGSKCSHCSRCNATSNTTVIEPLGHKYSAEWTVDKKASCTEAGSESHHCNVCGAKSDVSEIAALGHDYSTEFSVDKQATCTDAGIKSRHCSRCNSKTDETPVAALGHSYSPSFTTDRSATCTTDGQRSRHCSRCSIKIDITSVPRLGHDYSSTKTVDKQPTCTEDGQSSLHCSRCKEKTEITALPKLGHNVISQSVTDPTCTEQGYTSYVCSRCGSYKADFVAATGHSFKMGTCTTCSFKDENCFIVKRFIAPAYYSWTHGLTSFYVKLDQALLDLISANPNKNLIVSVEFEMMYKGFGEDGFCLNKEQPYFQVEESGSKKYYCGSVEDVACNMKTYTKLETGATIPAKDVVSQYLYFVVTVPTNDSLAATIWYFRNFTVCIQIEP